MPDYFEDQYPRGEGLKNTHLRVSPRSRNLLILAAAMIAVGVIVLTMWPRHQSANPEQEKAKAKATDEREGKGGGEVELSPQALAAAGIEVVAVTERPAIALPRVTGAVEVNQQQTQQVTPLVSGRIERVNVVLGDHVRPGAE